MKQCTFLKKMILSHFPLNSLLSNVNLGSKRMKIIGVLIFITEKSNDVFRFSLTPRNFRG